MNKETLGQAYLKLAKRPYKATNAYDDVIQDMIKSVRKALSLTTKEPNDNKETKGANNERRNK